MPDGLRGSEGTFSLCTFAYVDSLARAWQLSEARVTFDLNPPSASLRQPSIPTRRAVLAAEVHVAQTMPAAVAPTPED